jgi:hypothetical protein
MEAFDYAKLKDEVSKQTILSRAAVSDLIDVCESYGLKPAIDDVLKIIGRSIIAGFSPSGYVSAVLDLASEAVVKRATDMLFEELSKPCV